jgi:hypothetical protein
MNFPAGLESIPSSIKNFKDDPLFEVGPIFNQRDVPEVGTPVTLHMLPPETREIIFDFLFSESKKGETR